MQIGQFAFQQQMIMVGAADIAGAARPGAGALHRLTHRLDHRRMLAHAQIIVGTPDSDILYPIRRMVGGTGKFARLTFKLGEVPIVAFGFQSVELFVEKIVKVHHCHLSFII